MCSLCGILGCDDHWTNAIARPGIYSRNHDVRSRRAEESRRMKAVNAILSLSAAEAGYLAGAVLCRRLAHRKIQRLRGPVASVARGRGPGRSRFRPLGREFHVLHGGPVMTTPVLLLTGFLGSGKTTLLQRLLADPSMQGAAVLINEFGEVGLDHHLLDRIDDNVVLLKSGCICCTVRGEVADALENLNGLRSRGEIAFDRVVIETTGLADPYPVLQTLTAHPVLRSHFANGGVLTTVDAVNAMRQVEHRAEAVRQIAAADRIVLTKTDLADQGDEAALRDRLGRINPAAQIVSSAEGIEAIIGAFGPTTFVVPARGHDCNDHCDHGHHHHHHHHDEALGVTSFSLVIDQAVDWTHVRNMADAAAAQAWRQDFQGKGHPCAGGRGSPHRRAWRPASGPCAHPSAKLARGTASIAPRLHHGRAVPRGACAGPSRPSRVSRRSGRLHDRPTAAHPDDRNPALASFEGSRRGRSGVSNWNSSRRISTAPNGRRRWIPPAMTSMTSVSTIWISSGTGAPSSRSRRGGSATGPIWMNFPGYPDRRGGREWAMCLPRNCSCNMT